MLIAYVIGSIATLLLTKNYIFEAGVVNTIDHLIDDGYLASKIHSDGQVEIITINDYLKTKKQLP